jgi:hypothetical protein
MVNKCDFENCMFSHPVTSALNIEKTPEREMETPSAPQEEDFINLPTTGPVVRTEPRAQPQTPQVEGLSSQQWEEIRQVTMRQITMHMEQMLPQILTQITDAITKKTISHK